MKFRKYKLGGRIRNLEIALSGEVGADIEGGGWYGASHKKRISSLENSMNMAINKLTNLEDILIKSGILVEVERFIADYSIDYSRANGLSLAGTQLYTSKTKFYNVATKKESQGE